MGSPRVGSNPTGVVFWKDFNSISGPVVEYIIAVDVTQVRFPADAHSIRTLP